MHREAARCYIIANKRGGTLYTGVTSALAPPKIELIEGINPDWRGLFDDVF